MLTYVMVLSDLHLAPTFASARAPYRDATRSPGPALARTIMEAVARAHRDRAELEIVLNGDVLDLDAPRCARDIEEGRPALDVRKEEGAVRAAIEALHAHGSFVNAVREAAWSGVQVFVLPGNHDAQVVLPGVREVLANAFSNGTRSVRDPLSPSPFPPAREARIQFRSWIHRSGPVLVEHGQQYDPLCVATRLGAVGGRLEATAGTVSSFYGPALLAGADPFAIDPFVERRAIVRSLREAAVQGGGAPALRCLRELLAACAERAAGPDPAWLDAVGDEVKASRDVLERHAALAAPKAQPALLLEAARGGHDYGADVDARLRSAMTAAAGLHGAQAVVVGHTHAAMRSTLPNGSVLVNAGTWAPRPEPNAPAGSFAWLAHDGTRLLSAEVVEVRR